MGKTTCVVAFMAFGVTLAIPNSGAAQIPNEFTNLKLLPEDISRARLVGIMRNFAGALGTNCGYCHVGEDPATLVDFDFASDEKETKRVARIMYEMVAAINEDHLEKTGREDRIEVTCNTCHHGYNKPADLQTELLVAREESGFDGLKAKYDELREAYFGRAIFDFGQGTLTGLAGQLARQEHFGDAVSVLEMNLGFFPESQSIWWELGQTLEAAGDSEEAVSAYRNGIAADPESGFTQFFQDRIDALGG